MAVIDSEDRAEELVSKIITSVNILESYPLKKLTLYSKIGVFPHPDEIDENGPEETGERRPQTLGEMGAYCLEVRPEDAYCMIEDGQYSVGYRPRNYVFEYLKDRGGYVYINLLRASGQQTLTVTSLDPIKPLLRISPEERLNYLRQFIDEINSVRDYEHERRLEKQRLPEEIYAIENAQGRPKTLQAPLDAFGIDAFETF
jgi:hypothetical protein